MTEFTEPQADDFEYWVIKASTHTELTDTLNEAAKSCWEPVNYGIWSYGTGFGTNLERGEHFVILRRNTAYVEKRIVEEQDALAKGDYSDDPEEREWAERFLKETKRDGYVAAE